MLKMAIMIFYFFYFYDNDDDCVIHDSSALLSTSFPGSYLFLPRESTLVAAGHVPTYTTQISTEAGFLILSTLSMEVTVALPYRRYFHTPFES